MEGKSAMLVGASGLVGGELLNYLLGAPEYTKIISLVRKPQGLRHPKLVEKVVDFDQLHLYKDCFNVADVFCCLGTTITIAKSRDAFKKVDVDYPLEIAKLAKVVPVEKFLIISSMGANSKSTVFYSKMKGLLEEQLMEIGITSLHIFRPSLLVGNRKELRLGEKVSAFLGKKLAFVFVGSLKKYKPIEAKRVALGMYKAAQQKNIGTHIYRSDEIDSFV